MKEKVEREVKVNIGHSWPAGQEEYKKKGVCSKEKVSGKTETNETLEKERKVWRKMLKWAPRGGWHETDGEKWREGKETEDGVRRNTWRQGHRDGYTKGGKWDKSDWKRKEKRQMIQTSLRLMMDERASPDGSLLSYMDIKYNVYMPFLLLPHYKPTSRLGLDQPIRSLDPLLSVQD